MAAKKGSKNPNAGRKKGSVNLVKKKIQELAEPFGEAALKVLADILMDTAAKHGDRITAAKELLDRGYGKAPQAITGDDNTNVGVVFSVFKK